MSGVFRSTQNLFHIGPKGPRHGPGGGLLGRDRDPYYGNVAQDVLSQKGGEKKYARQLLADGAVKEHGRIKRYSGSGQLLGGG